MEIRARIAATDELPLCMEIRRRVFTLGQGVAPDIELDGLDGECAHFVAFADGVAIGTARLREVEGSAKAERVAVLEEQRGSGIGRELMRVLEAEASARGFEELVLHAQADVVEFYTKLGYRLTGELFYEADIPHRPMAKDLPGRAVHRSGEA